MLDFIINYFLFFELAGMVIMGFMAMGTVKLCLVIAKITNVRFH